ncbi:MAG: pyruvate dehydrogenase complex dihydrolipoamide acetyltransferase [Bacteroidia bacterium]
MAEIVRMPKLSDTMTEGVVAKWHKKVGDKVKSGDLLADIETDKATMEFESFQDGVLLYVGVEQGKGAPVDSILAILGKEGEDISALIKDASASLSNQSTSPVKEETKKDTKEETKKDTATTNTAAPTVPPTVQIVRMPKLSDTMTDGVVAKWHKKVGDKVKSGELLADIETDKATMEFESFQDGVILYQGVEQGKGAPVDSVLAILGKGDEDIKAIVEYEKNKAASASITTGLLSQQNEKKEAVAETKVANASNPAQKAEKNGTTTERLKASPLAKMLAKEKGIDLTVVHGSGDSGRIIKKDIEFFTTSGVAQKYVGVESFTDEPASQMRKTIAKRLTESKNGAPHFYLTIELDMDNAVATRAAINNISEVKVSYNDMVIKAVAAALRKHPKVNSSWMGDKIRYNHHIHIGVAIAVEDGLLVPVVRFADNKTFSQIAAEVKEYGKRAKEKKLQPADWEGNTFTVSNLGMFGIEEFTSIINTPESCIMAVGAIRQVPVVKNGQVVPGNVMKVTLSCDHRSVDGATGAAFLQTFKQMLENPVMMFL